MTPSLRIQLLPGVSCHVSVPSPPTLLSANEVVKSFIGSLEVPLISRSHIEGYFWKIHLDMFLQLHPLELQAGQ